MQRLAKNFFSVESVSWLPVERGVSMDQLYRQRSVCELHRIGSILFGRIKWDFDYESKSVLERHAWLLPLRCKRVSLNDLHTVVLYAEEVGNVDDSGSWTGYTIRLYGDRVRMDMGLPEPDVETVRQRGQRIADIVGLPFDDRSHETEYNLTEGPILGKLGCLCLTLLLLLGPVLISESGIGHNFSTWLTAILLMAGLSLIAVSVPEIRRRIWEFQEKEKRYRSRRKGNRADSKEK